MGESDIISKFFEGQTGSVRIYRRAMQLSFAGIERCESLGAGHQPARKQGSEVGQHQNELGRGL